MRGHHRGPEPAGEERRQGEDPDLGEHVHAHRRSDGEHGAQVHARATLSGRHGPRGGEDDGGEHHTPHAGRQPRAERPQVREAQAGQVHGGQGVVPAHEHVAHRHVDRVGQAGRHDRRAREAVRLQEGLAREEDAEEEEARRLTHQVKLRLVRGVRGRAHGHQQQGEPVGGGDRRRPQQREGLQRGAQRRPRATGRARAERLRGEGLERHRHPDGEGLRGEGHVAPERGASQLLTGAAPEDGCVHQAHEDESDLGDGDGPGQGGERPELRPGARGGGEGGGHGRHGSGDGRHRALLTHRAYPRPPRPRATRLMASMRAMRRLAGKSWRGGMSEGLLPFVR